MTQSQSQSQSQETVLPSKTSHPSHTTADAIVDEIRIPSADARRHTNRGGSGGTRAGRLNIHSVVASDKRERN